MVTPRQLPLFSLSKHSATEQCRIDRRISRLLAHLVRTRRKKRKEKKTSEWGPPNKLVVQIVGARLLAFYSFIYLHPVCLIERDISPPNPQKWYRKKETFRPSCEQFSFRSRSPTQEKKIKKNNCNLGSSVDEQMHWNLESLHLCLSLKCCA